MVLVIMRIIFDSDREYIDKFKVAPTHPDFMTDQDLIAERKKLISMANLITAELDFRSFISEDTKVAMKYVLMSIVKMDKVAEDESSLKALIPEMPIVAETAEVTAVHVADVEVEEIKDKED